jgi:hypothetical protein
MLTSTLWKASTVAMMMLMASHPSVVVVVSAATPQVPSSCPASSSRPQSAPQIFGVAKRLPTVAMLSVRGGAVLEPETLDDVQAIILKASSEQKLVVIDFTGIAFSSSSKTILNDDPPLYY